MKYTSLTLAALLSLHALADAQFGVTVRTRDGAGAATDRLRIETGVADAAVEFTNAYLQFGSVSAPALSTAGSGRLYFNGTQFQVSQDGGVYVPLVTGGALTSVNGETGAALTLTAAGTGGLGVSVSATNTIQFSLNDVWVDAAGDMMTGAMTLNSYQEWGGIAAPAVAPAGTGRIYFDSTAGAFQISEDAGAYIPLLGGGVTSLDFGAGVQTGALALPADGSVTNYLQNQTAGIQVAGFRVNGNGILGGVLQAGGTTAVAYSRVGTAVTSQGLASASDLLVSGITELDGTVHMDGDFADQALATNMVGNGWDITGATLEADTTITTNGGTVIIAAFMSIDMDWTAVTSSWFGIEIWRDGVEISDLSMISIGDLEYGNANLVWTDTPAAGTYTYELRSGTGDAGTATVYGSGITAVEIKD